MIYEEKVVIDHRNLWATMDDVDGSGSLHLNGHSVFRVWWRWTKVFDGTSEKTCLCPNFENIKDSNSFWRRSTVSRSKLDVSVSELSSKLEKHIVSNIIEEA